MIGDASVGIQIPGQAGDDYKIKSWMTDRGDYSSSFLSATFLVTSYMIGVAMKIEA